MQHLKLVQYVPINMFIPFTFAMQNAKFEVLNYYSCQDEEGT